MTKRAFDHDSWNMYMNKLKLFLIFDQKFNDKNYLASDNIIQCANTVGPRYFSNPVQHIFSTKLTNQVQ